MLHVIYLQHMCIHHLYRASLGIHQSSLGGRISHNVTLQQKRSLIRQEQSSWSGGQAEQQLEINSENEKHAAKIVTVLEDAGLF